MKAKTIYRAVAAAGAVSLLALGHGTAWAETVDFATVAMPPNLAAGQPGNVGSPTFTDPGTGVEATGLYSTDGGVTWSAANLYRRNQPNDHGLGVCNDVEAGGAFPAADCPGPLGGGDVNELDNEGEDELIVLKRPDGYKWVSVQISSMDTNPNAGPIPERGQLWADADGIPNNGPGAVGDVVIPATDNPFTGGVQPVEFTINIPAAFASANHLIFEPYDHVDGLNADNDFLVWKASVQAMGGQGCTPGYWKQPHHFDSWVGYDPADIFDDVFGVALFPDLTLLDALRQGGGQEKALGRHAVAALLNASSPDVSYAFSSAEVIATVQAAVASGEFESAKDLLAYENELGCPLN